MSTRIAIDTKYYNCSSILFFFTIPGGHTQYVVFFRTKAPIRETRKFETRCVCMCPSRIVAADSSIGNGAILIAILAARHRPTVRCVVTDSMPLPRIITLADVVVRRVAIATGKVGWLRFRGRLCMIVSMCDCAASRRHVRMA